MNDETKRALESLRREMADGDPDWWKRERLIFNHIDAEPARQAAAREEQREEVEVEMHNAGFSVDNGLAATIHNVADELRTLRAKYDELHTAAGNWLRQRDLAFDREEEVRSQLRELREVAERNVADLQHLRQSSIALTDERNALREALERANEGVRYWTDLAQAEARDAAALRARVAELEERMAVMLHAGPSTALAVSVFDRAKKAEAQVAAARAECARVHGAPKCMDAYDVATDVRRAMDEALKAERKH